MSETTRMKSLIKPTIETTNRPKRAAIYVRISRDRVGAGLGVERQEDDCRVLAKQMGLKVVRVLVDNDISAYSGKKRPGYMELLRMIESGEIDTVIAYHTDRLHRRLRDLLDYTDVVEKSGTKTITVKAGDIDLSTSQGITFAQLSGVIAESFVRTNTEKLQRAKLQAAQSGLYRGGQRPFGWDDGAMVVRESEAAIVREMTERFIAGDSWRTIGRILNERGVKTTHGRMWNAVKVRNVTIRPRNTGLLDHNGLAQYEAQWEPIIDRETWAQLQTAIDVSKSLHTQRGPGRRYLLKGFAFCGLCGNELNIYSGHRDKNGIYIPSFGCRSDDEERGKIGCGGVRRAVAPLDDLVIESVLYRLETDELAKLINAGASEAPRLRVLLNERRSQDIRLQEVLTLFSRGELDFVEYTSAKTQAQSRLDELDNQISNISRHSVLSSIPVGVTLRDAWEAADLEWRRQLVALVVDRVVILPRDPHAKRSRYKEWIFNPSDVRIEWKQ